LRDSGSHHYPDPSRSVGTVLDDAVAEVTLVGQLEVDSHPVGEGPVAAAEDRWADVSGRPTSALHVKQFASGIGKA